MRDPLWVLLLLAAFDAIALIEAIGSQRWQIDASFEAESTGVGCDFPRFDPETDTFEDFQDRPFIIDSDATASWAAHSTWQKGALIKKYGDRVIRYDSHSSIVYSGGEAGIPITLRDLIGAINGSRIGRDETDAECDVTVGDGNCSDGGGEADVGSDAFVFDAAVMSAIPELKQDISVPSPFSDWHNATYEDQGNVWHILSLGPSRAGLPFHSHGKTWLGVIHGAKRWFVYPPGYTPPLTLMQTFNPLLPVESWYNDIYLKNFESDSSYAKPPLMDSKQLRAPPGAGYRPLECVQRAGEVVFLPSRWSHMTMNIGETIAVGGQAGLGAEQRLNSSLKIVKQNPHDFEALKDVGLGRVHLVVHWKDKLEGVVPPDEPLFELLQESQLIELQKLTEDPFIALHFDSSRGLFLNYTQGEVAELINDWRSLAYQLIDVANTAGVVTSFQGDGDDKMTEGGILYDPSMRVVVYDGAIKDINDPVNVTKFSYNGPGNGVDCSSILLSEFEEEKGATKDIQLRYFRNIDLLRKCVEIVMKRRNIVPGSVIGTRGTTATQRGIAESIKHLRRAIDVKPMHPEARCMLAQVQGINNQFEDMDQTITEAKEVFDGMLQDDRLSKQALASVYHKLATTYLSVDRHLEALPYFELSLQILPLYIPALVDRVMAHVLFLKTKINKVKAREKALKRKMKGRQQLIKYYKHMGDTTAAARVKEELDALTATQNPDEKVVQRQELDTLKAVLKQLQDVAPEHRAMVGFRTVLPEIEKAVAVV